MARVDVNRAMFNQFELGVADGLLSIMEETVARAASSAPDDPSTSWSRIRESGGAAAWVNGKKVGGNGDKPRRERTNRGPGFVIALGGFGSPLSHLHERGTVKMRARPFLLPAFQQTVSAMAGEVGQYIRRRLPRG